MDGWVRILLWWSEAPLPLNLGWLMGLGGEEEAFSLLDLGVAEDGAAPPLRLRPEVPLGVSTFLPPSGVPNT